MEDVHPKPVRPVLQWHRRRQKVALVSQRARWELLQASTAQFTVSESFTLGWFNVMLRHLWPTVLEKEVADSAAKNIKVPAVPHAAGLGLRAPRRSEVAQAIAKLLLLEASAFRNFRVRVRVRVKALSVEPVICRRRSRSCCWRAATRRR